MYQLQMKETIVCEKSDGVRYFLCELVVRNQPTWLLVDRQYDFRNVALSFDMADINHGKYQDKDSSILRNVFDGELIQDKPWRKGQSEPVFLVFDALLVDRKNLIGLTFDHRLTAADAYIE